MYSILPWPNGWSLSTGLLAIFAPITVTMLEEASDRLLAASAVIDTEWLTVPQINFRTLSSRLQRMPTMPLSTP